MSRHKLIFRKGKNITGSSYFSVSSILLSQSIFPEMLLKQLHFCCHKRAIVVQCSCLSLGNCWWKWLCFPSTLTSNELLDSEWIATVGSYSMHCPFPLGYTLNKHLYHNIKKLFLLVYFCCSFRTDTFGLISAYFNLNKLLIKGHKSLLSIYASKSCI